MSAAGTAEEGATMQVPMLDLQAQYRPIRDAVLDVVMRVCDSQRFIMGPEVEAMERELAAYLGVTHAVGVSSGTDALLLGMMARVRGVTAAAAAAGSMLYVTGSMSTNTGVAPIRAMHPAVAKKE